MRDIIGLALFAVAAALVYAGLAHRRKALATRGEAPGEDDDAIDVNSLSMMGKILPPIIVVVLALVGVKTVFMYFIVGGGRLFSLIDLAGFLALLAGYGTWIVLKTKYRTSLAAAAEHGDHTAPPASGANTAVQEPLRPHYQGG